MREARRLLRSAALALLLHSAPLTTLTLPALNSHATAAPPPDAVLNLKKAFTAAQEGRTKNAVALLDVAVRDFAKEPADERAALYKTRGALRFALSDAAGAVDDLTEAIRLAEEPEARAAADPAELQRTYQLRARAHERLGLWSAQERDITAAIERLDDLSLLESTNPYLYAERVVARLRTGQFAGAVDDAEVADADFRAIGEKIRRTTLGADKSLALYGAGRLDEAVEAMLDTFRKKGLPASNNPDDIALLQELSRKDAELHLAYAAHLHVAGREAEAVKNWESGCIRLDAYVADGTARFNEEERLREKEAEVAEASGRDTRLRASSVRENPLNSALGAWLNGMDPESPYVTQRPGQAFFWYKEGEGSVERRDAGNALAQVDPLLSCASFEDEAWVKANRPEWPPSLRARVGEFVLASGPKAR